MRIRSTLKFSFKHFILFSREIYMNVKNNVDIGGK